MSELQQKEILSRRFPDEIFGSFDGYCSLLYAVHNISIHTTDDAINRTQLQSAFADFYKPTLRELFDTVALQTKSKWKYDPGHDYWVFSKTESAKPFMISLASGWSATDNGLQVNYRPAAFPVGMDVYCFGKHSATRGEDEDTLSQKVRDSLATYFASNFKKGVGISDMEKAGVDKTQALYFETSARPGTTWRQWVFVKNGQAFAIVSALPDDKQLESDVKAMVGSFRVLPSSNSTDSL